MIICDNEITYMWDFGQHLGVMSNSPQGFRSQLRRILRS